MSHSHLLKWKQKALNVYFRRFLTHVLLIVYKQLRSRCLIMEINMDNTASILLRNLEEHQSYILNKYDGIEKKNQWLWPLSTYENMKNVTWYVVIRIDLNYDTLEGKKRWYFYRVIIPLKNLNLLNHIH